MGTTSSPDLPDFELVLQPVLVELLARLLDELTTLHRKGGDRNDDPVLARLYPVTNDVPLVDGELSNLIHPEVHRARQVALDRVAALLATTGETDDGAVIALDEELAGLLLGVVNDIRLSLAARVSPQLSAKATANWPPPDLSRSQLRTLELVDHLAWLQEELIGVLDPVSGSHHDEDH